MDAGTSVISEFYTPLVPKEHDFLNTIGGLIKEKDQLAEKGEDTDGCQYC